ncbi:MAG: hypothetical protein K8W52_35700, partial [Deltaproteobacteria bacterium]|nr:hypothetical protein [Deltaproteobacteria bacterium]
MASRRALAATAAIALGGWWLACGERAAGPAAPRPRGAVPAPTTGHTGAAVATAGAAPGSDR